jgi:hypothetical protein
MDITLKPSEPEWVPVLREALRNLDDLSAKWRGGDFDFEGGRNQYLSERQIHYNSIRQAGYKMKDARNALREYDQASTEVPPPNLTTE